MRLRPGMLFLAALLLGCSSRSPVSPALESLSSHFASKKAVVLGEGAASRLQPGDVFPASGEAAIQFRSGSEIVRVRQVGATGAAHRADRSLAYVHGASTSFWSCVGKDYEEWILGHANAQGVIAEYALEEGTFVLREGTVYVLTAAGQPALTVSAPEAFDSAGVRFEPALRIAGGNLQVAVGERRGLLLVDPLWATTGSMATNRARFSSVMLHTGKLLVMGGTDNISGNNKSELYDPVTGLWTASGTMAVAHREYASSLLKNGKVLVSGGRDLFSKSIANADLYDPIAGTWTPTGPLGTARHFHTSTLLPNGKVLIAGGSNAATASVTLLTCELFDPATGMFTPTGAMANIREEHSAVLLANGKVLVSGGNQPVNGSATPTSELYDPATGMWSSTGNLTTARLTHSMTLMANGKVITHGGTVGGVPTGNVELYDVAAGTWGPGPSLLGVRTLSSQTLLPSGKILVAGGRTTTIAYLNTVELYDPVANSWANAGTMSIAHAIHIAAILPNGKVLIAGGQTGTNNSTFTNVAELYDPLLPSTVGAGNSFDFHLGPTLTQLTNGELLIAGGAMAASSANYAERFNPTVATPTAVGSGLLGPRTSHTATLLSNGHVLVTGGAGAPVSRQDCVSYSVGAGWTAAGSLAAGREQHTATLLPNGKILIAGGFNGTTLLNTAELFDPASGTSVPTGALTAARRGHTATLLPNGKVLIVAGEGAAAAALGTCELYDPATGMFTPAPSLITARKSQATVLLPNGRALTIGGLTTGGGAIASAESWDPTQPAWVAAGTLTTPRTSPNCAALMPSGRVFFGGGRSGPSGALSNLDAYDPATNSWSALPPLIIARGLPNCAVAPSGKLFVYGGTDLGGTPNTLAEVYDEGRGALAAATPIVTSIPPATVAGGSLTINGTALTGISEGSSGYYNSSHTDAPLVQLQRVDSGATIWAVVTNWSATAIAFTVPASLFNGPHLLRVFANGMYGNAVPLVVGTVVLGPPGASCGSTADCQAGLFCTDGVCCTTACNGGACDACSVLAGAAVNGMCAILPSSATCRPALGTCDVAESCDGSSPACPPDGYAPSSTLCRTEVGLCDLAESCTGMSAVCPIDGFAPTSRQCRGPAGVCDAAEFCDGVTNTCPMDGFAPASVECRPASGLCDVADFCSGSAIGCPADAVAPAMTACRPTADLCDLPEVCDGISPQCPADAFAPSSQQCRAVSGVCDVAENCSGTSAGCPADVFLGSSAGCRAAVGICDLAEVCSGASAGCPADVGVADGTACDDGTFCNGVERCGARLCQAATMPVCDPLSPEVLMCSEVDRACHPVPNQPPVITHDANLIAGVGIAYVYNSLQQVRAQGSQPLTFARCGGPIEFQVDAQTGAVSWLPSSAQVAALCVQATNAFGSDSYNFSVTVTSLSPSEPIARFVATPSTGPAPLAVGFDASGSTADPSAPLASYRWQFGDGAAQALGVSTNHTYLLPGGYLPMLTVTDAAGRQASVKHPVLVFGSSGSQPPSARIVASAISGVDALEVDFRCDCLAGGAPIIAYDWSFGPATATVADPSFTFAPGRYHVGLRVFDSAGLSGSDRIEIEVKGGTNRPPSCAITATPSVGLAPLAVTYVSAFSDLDGTIASHGVTFEDGTTSVAASVTHVETLPGRHLANLRVVDDKGFSCLDSVAVTALGPGNRLPPEFVSQAERSAFCGKPYRYLPVVAGDGPFQFELGANAPRGVTLEAETGELAWTPTADQKGPQNLRVHATASAGSADQTISVEVSCEPRQVAVGCGCAATAGAWPMGLLALGLLRFRRRR